jgi:ketosteroid isomerase-like protein
MSQENVDLFWRGVKAFNERDVESLEGWVTDDFEFIPYLAGRLETATYRGREGLRKYQDDADGAWESFEVKIDEVKDLGDRVFATGEIHGRGRTSGLDVQFPLTWLVEFRDGKLSRNRSFADRDEALQAAGLSGS